MPTRLIINATILNLSRQTGLGVYTTNLLPALLQLAIQDERFDEIVIAGRADRLGQILGGVPDQSKIRVKLIDTEHPIYRLVALNQLAAAERKRSRQLVFYSPTHHGVIRCGLKQIITVHDLFARLFPYNYRQQYYYFRYYLPRVLARTCRVVVDSASTARDLQRFYPDGPKAQVVHAALRADLALTTPRELPSLAGQRFFVFVGPNYWYKNCERLIDAFAAYRQVESARLVFVGGREVYLRALKAHLEKHDVRTKDDVVFRDYLSTAELVWLYQNAAALMITTLYEGFGLPALEAMACGCPVIASRAGSLPEVCGEAALYVEPEDVSQISRAMRSVTSDSQLRATLIAAGTENVTRFNWEISARQVYHVITNCLNAGSGEN